MCLIAWCAKLILLPSVSLFLPTLLLTHPESACDSLLCVRGWMGFRGVQFLVAPVTPLSHGFMMHLPVSKAITPLSNPTENLEKRIQAYCRKTTHRKKQKNLFSRMPLYLIPLRLCQIKKHEYKRNRLEVFVWGSWLKSKDRCLYPPAAGLTGLSALRQAQDECLLDKILKGQREIYFCSADIIAVT